MNPHLPDPPADPAHGRPQNLCHSLLVIGHWSLIIASRLAGMRPPYPRSPLREFTPCAPGRSTPSCQEANPTRHCRYPPHPKISLPVASRVRHGAPIIARFFMVFATDRMDVAEAVTGPCYARKCDIAELLQHGISV